MGRVIADAACAFATTLFHVVPSQEEGCLQYPAGYGGRGPGSGRRGDEAPVTHIQAWWAVVLPVHPVSCVGQAGRCSGTRPPPVPALQQRGGAAPAWLRPHKPAEAPMSAVDLGRARLRAPPHPLQWHGGKLLIVRRLWAAAFSDKARPGGVGQPTRKRSRWGTLPRAGLSARPP